MAINFPSSPNVNDTYQVNGRYYLWNGSKWRRQRARVESAPLSLSVSQDFNAGGSALHVDSANESVGIGTASPNASEALTVGGDTSITGNLSVSGSITVPTQIASTNDTKVATTEYVTTAISNLIGGAPAALDTLNELAAALDDDASYATTITNALALKLDSSSYTAADVLAKILTVDGDSSGLDADTLDGSHASAFAASSHTHSYADSSHTHSYASTSHTHSYASTSHTHSYAAVNGSYGTDFYANQSFADNWFRPTGTTGLYFQSYAGGWYMQDTTWVRIYNGKYLYTNGGRFAAYRNAQEADWENSVIRGESGASYSGYSFRCANSDTHTGQFRPASNRWYVRNHNDGSAWSLHAYIINPSSRRHKQDIETWGVAKSLSSGVNATYDTTATNIMKQMRPVFYRLNKKDRLPRDIPDERRAKALRRLNKYRIASGLGVFDSDEVIHECGRDCDGSLESPCLLYKDWEGGTLGFIAEEIAELVPEACYFDVKPDSAFQGEIDGLDPIALTAVLAKSLQEIEARLSALESS